MVTLTQGLVVERDAHPIAELRAGRPVVLWWSGQGPAMGLLVAAGSLVSTATMAFLVRHCSGLVCATVPAAECVRLGLPAMPLSDEIGPASAMRVTVDAADGIGTGISAHDRAHTVRLLADRATDRDAFTRPGHVIPVRVDSDPVHNGPAQRVADLVRAAGLGATGTYSQLVTADGPHLADHRSIVYFAFRHHLALVEQETQR